MSVLLLLPVATAILKYNAQTPGSYKKENKKETKLEHKKNEMKTYLLLTRHQWKRNQQE
jgi:hypothetical protein